MSDEELGRMLRGLIRTSADLGWLARDLGIPREQATTDAADGPEADRLIAQLIPMIRSEAP